MATNQIKTRIVLRNDIAANWTANNPIMLAGELGVESDTGYFKIGDGTTTWNDLTYANKFEATPAAAHYEVETQEGEDDLAALARIVGGATLNKDDIGIVKHPIAGDAMSYTAYVYNGSAWSAMDGNYNASNVYFATDLTATAPVGVVEIPASGSTTIAAAGKSLKDVLASILAKRVAPKATAPTASINFTNATKSLEVGTTVTPTYAATFNPGSYTYGPATGIEVSAWSISDGTTTLTTASGSFPELTIGDQAGSPATVSLTATATHTQGAVPVDNLGDEVPGVQIAAGSVSATTSTKLTCYRNFFYGSLTTSTAEAPLTSDLIRGLTKGGAYAGAKTLTVNAGAQGAKRVVVAYPKSTARAGLKEVLLTSSMNADITDAYVAQEVNVEGANGYAAIPYTVYVYEPAELGSDEVHQIKLA